MFWKIEIKDKPGVFDAVGEGVKKDILDLGITCEREVRFAQVYLLEGNLSEDEVGTICAELLVDKISQTYSLNETTSQRNLSLKSPIIPG